MTGTLLSLLNDLNIQPVLMDVGATGGAPSLWAKIASRSVYVGFDPDEREMQHGDFSRFSQKIILNDAVTDDPGAKKVHFYLTRSPQCSSTLLPEADALSDYLFSEAFEVAGETDVSAKTLQNALERLELPRVDWIKMDTQGTDLRLFYSLPQTVRSQILAVDLEPGLIHAYQGEDLFVDVHRRLMTDGFWLSRMPVHGSVRMKHSTKEELARRHPHVNVKKIGGALRASPGWVEARYFRTIESLDAMGAVPYHYGLLWVFALLDGQPGFSLDLALAYKRRFGEDSISRMMYEEPLRQVRLALRRQMLQQTALIPVRILRKIQRTWKNR